MQPQCALCGDRCSNATCCLDCKAVFYCCPEHREIHYRQVHELECSRLLAHRQRRLDKPGFTLEALPKGKLWNETRVSEIGMPDRKDWAKMWGVDEQLVPCMETRVDSGGINTWEDYYTVRGLPLDSPVSVLMHYPLSVYYSLKLKESLSGVRLEGSLKVCYLGIERELRLFPLFRELSSLLDPSNNLDFYFIGPEVPQELDGRTTSIRNPSPLKCSYTNCSCQRSSVVPTQQLGLQRLDRENAIWLTVPVGDLKSGASGLTTFYFIKGVYHECPEDLAPDLIFCSNAGLEVYDTWAPTVDRIMREKTFTVITDYTEEAIHRSVQYLKHLKYTSTMTFLNPFHCPIGEDSIIDVPCASNAFGLILNGPLA